jgi:hypothetical protein
LRERENNVFVEEVEDELTVPDIGPSAMYQDQSPEKLELSKCVISGLYCSHSLITIETHANVSFKDHGNIISSVSDS